MKTLHKICAALMFIDLFITAANSLEKLVLLVLALSFFEVLEKVSND